MEAAAVEAAATLEGAVEAATLEGAVEAVEAAAIMEAVMEGAGIMEAAVSMAEAA